MIIVGIYGAFDWDATDATGEHFLHDAGCSLFIDGKHICSITEERLSRIKYDGSYPEKSIGYCLKYAGITSDKVDKVYSVPPHQFISLDQVDSGLAEKMLKKSFPNASVHFLGHHFCHAVSSVYSSPFNEGTFLTLDGGGSAIADFFKHSIDHIENNSIGYFNKEKRIFRFYNMWENSYNNFGSFYTAASHGIYYEMIGEESPMDWRVIMGMPGKIMGLSAYGSTEHYVPGYKITNHSIPYANISNKWFSGVSPQDSAAWIQKTFEDGLVDLLKALRKNHLSENICFSGGCFLNILSNSKILKSELFDNVHIPPFTDDSGVSLGAAIWGCLENELEVELPNNLALLGADYSHETIKESLDLFDLKYRESNLVEVASLIDSGKIIGWFQGKSEHGPRALGSRSIFMNPYRAENKDILNDRVKHREYWRPFAGIVQEDKVSDYFEESFPTPYMLYTQHAKTDILPAITHEDGTCRIQTVNREQNEKVYDLLSLLDHPVVLNTSFNDSGEPIVETPYHAIKAFLNMDIDHLVIGDFIVDK